MSLLNTLIQIEIQEKAKLAALKLDVELPKDEFNSSQKAELFKKASTYLEKNIVNNIESIERNIFSILQKNQ